MASLRRFPHSSFFYACFTLPNGKRVQRSTKERSRKLAQVKADEWEQLSKTKAKAKQAHRVIAEIYKAAHHEELPQTTTRAFLTAWLLRRKSEVAPATYASYEGRSSDLIMWLGDKAETPLAELDKSDFIGYRDYLISRVSSSTVNHGIKVLRSIFEDARRDGYCADNPARDCPLLKREHPKETRRPFRLNELRDVLAHSSSEWKSMILFGIYTGQRLRDLATLRWSNIDLDSLEVHLRTSKTRRMVRIPISKPLEAHIRNLTSSKDSNEAIHPTFSHLPASSLSNQFVEVLVAAGLLQPRSHEATGKGRRSRRKASELSFHSLRHTATSLMKNAGISSAIVQDIIGHDSAEISAQYTHIDMDSKRKAIESLPNITTT